MEDNGPVQELQRISAGVQPFKEDVLVTKDLNNEHRNQ